MTTRKKPSASKGAVEKLKLKKETLKDLDVKGKGRKIKGGAIPIRTVDFGCPA